MVAAVTRRTLLFAPFLLATKAEAAGVHVTGTLSATDSERTEQIANFGKALALVVNDKALWAQIDLMLNQRVQFSLFTL